MACGKTATAEDRLELFRFLVNKRTLTWEETATDDLQRHSKQGPQVYTYQIDAMRQFDVLIPRMDKNKWKLDRGQDWSDFFDLTFDEIKIVYELAREIWTSSNDSGYTPRYNF